MKKNEISLLKTLCEMNAISGYENKIAKLILDKANECNYEIITDNLGSIFGIKKSKNENAKKVMIVGHMDEVGFMVKEIQNNGLIKAAPIGGILDNILLTTRVVLFDKKGNAYHGCILGSSSHTGEVQDVILNNMLFDFGFSSAEEVFKNDINLGSMIAFDTPFVEIGQDKVLAKAIDDRYGIAVIIRLMEELKDVELDFDLYLGGSVQEEVGARGGQTSSYLIHPDLAIVLDCSAATDYLGGATGAIGKGVLIRVVDRSMISFKKLIDLQIKACERSKSKYQFFTTLGGTDAGVIHKNYDGIPTLNHCICARGIHTCSTIMDKNDFDYAKKSLKFLLTNLSSDMISAIKKGN